MATNLIITGGPTHDLTGTSAVLTALLEDEDLDSVVHADLDSAFAALADPRHVWDLVTVNTLRWQMKAERYAELRPAWGISTEPACGMRTDDHVRGGGGLLALHTAVISFDDSAVWHQLCGGSWNWDTSFHPPLGEVTVALTFEGRTHPATADAPDVFDLSDEVYCDLDVDPGLVPLATADVDGVPRPVVWAKEVGEGRVVVDLLGHDPASLREPAHGSIIRGAARWAVRQ